MNHTGIPLKLYNPLPDLSGPLSREEKIIIISSILSGIGTKAHFDIDILSTRIEQCLQIVEKNL